ncbi:MAG: protein kinase [Oscillospiraceae bacterium]|nr:protein kinase [Oscillospiraceae bacterium]
MDSIKAYCVNFDEHLEKLMKKSVFIGKGHNGIVFLLPDGNIIKIFEKNKIWEDEINILKKSQKSIFFPKIKSYGERYIIRELIPGEPLDKYIKKHGLSETLSNKLIDLLLEFKKLKFKRIDIRCKDIYVQNEHSIKIIDPKNHYRKTVDYPRHLMKGLYNRRCLYTFLNHLNKRDKGLYDEWKEKIFNYLENNIK